MPKNTLVNIITCHLLLAKLTFHLVKLEHICIHELLKQPVTKNDAIPDTWLEIPEPTGPNAVSTLVVDKNDIPLMVHLPKFLPDKSHVSSLAF